MDFGRLLTTTASTLFPEFAPVIGAASNLLGINSPPEHAHAAPPRGNNAVAPGPAIMSQYPMQQSAPQPGNSGYLGSTQLYPGMTAAPANGSQPAPVMPQSQGFTTNAITASTGQADEVPPSSPPLASQPQQVG